MMDQFDYAQASLPSASQAIRLLEIQPSGQTASSAAADDQHSAALVCTMAVTSISSPEPFKALSYCWGSDRRTHTITLQGKVFPITSSLDEALRHIRDPVKVVTVWIDQICINQKDDVEKSAQVGEMRSIYSKAEQVIIWLGPAADDSDFLMNWWQRIGQAMRELGIEQLYTRDNISQLFAIQKNINPEDEVTRRYQDMVRSTQHDIERLMRAVVSCTSRAWFWRVWIIQEMALCPDTAFVCGHKTVDITLVRLASPIFRSAMMAPLLDQPRTTTAGYDQLALQAEDRDPSHLFSTRHRRQNFEVGKDQGDELFNLLRKVFVGRNTRATLPRDRIYGLLGLAVDADTLSIEPDYASKSDAPAFISSAHSMLCSGRIELLSFSQFPKEDGLTSLPSWVPDWRPNLDPSFYTIYEHAEDHLLAASGTTPVSLVTQQDINILGLKGFIVDCIEEVGIIWQKSDSHRMHKARLEHIKDLCESSARKGHDIYPTVDRRNEAFWRIPVGDLYWTSEREHERASVRAREDYEDAVAIVDVMLEAESLTPERQEEKMGVIMARRMGCARYRSNMDALSGKRPFMTEKGYVGLCSPNAEPGDVVVVFCGARIPHVLRPSAGGRFTFLGEAYCDGVMDGEVTVSREEAIFLLE